jgi:hypothetical protein
MPTNTMTSYNNFMERFWQVVDEQADNVEHKRLYVYMYTHPDGHVFVQAYNEYHLFQQLHNEQKLKISDENIFATIEDAFEDYESEDMHEIVDCMLLNRGYWSDFSYTKIEFMKEYDNIK